MEKKEKIFQNIQKFISKYLLLIIAIVVLIIGVLSVFVTAYFTGTFDKPVEKTNYRFENPIYLISMISVGVGILYFIQKIAKKINTSLIFIALIIVIIFMQFKWVNKIKFIPISDQLSVIFLANDLNSGNYDTFKSNTSYFGTYPFQSGFIYYVAEVFKHLDKNSNLFLQQLNIWFSAISLLIMYGIICSLFKSKKVRIIGVFLLAAFSMYFLFFNVHVYGNIPGLTFSMLAIFCIIRYLKDNKIIYIGIASIAISIAILLKSNYNIFLCGIILTLFLEFLKNRKFKTLCSIIVITCTYVLLSCCFKCNFEKTIGGKMPEGIPMINYIYMGMEKPLDKSCGWYTQGSVDLLTDNNYDLDKTKKEAIRKIKLRSEELVRSPNEFIHYYSDKIASTWLNPTYQVIWCNYPGIQLQINSEYKTYIENSPRIQSILSGHLFKLEEKYFDALQSVIFLFGAIGIFSLYKKNKTENILLPIIFLGGFVFHIFWETKSVYVLQYYFLLVPYSSYGLYVFYKNLEDKFKKKDKLIVEVKERKMLNEKSINSSTNVF